MAQFGVESLKVNDQTKINISKACVTITFSE